MNREDLINGIIELGNIDIVMISDNLNDGELLVELETMKYNKRREDGIKYSDMMGAKLVLLNAPENVKQEMSLFFKSIQDYLTIGWWKSAQREMQTKTPTNYVTQTLINEIQLYIDTYVNNSYN